MGWGAEQSAFAVTGALLLLCTAIASNPRWAIGRMWLVVTVFASLAAIGAAFLWDADDGMDRAPRAWMSAVGPALLLLVWIGRMLAVARPRYRWLAWFAPRTGVTRQDNARAAATQDDVAARLERAADPHTPATELADLAYAFPDARVAVAANPSTPASVLTWLASTGGDDVAAAIAHRQDGGLDSP